MSTERWHQFQSEENQRLTDENKRLRNRIYRLTRELKRDYQWRRAELWKKRALEKAKKK